MSLLVSIQARWPDFRLQASFETSGEMIGIFGPSGAGKTTLLEIVAGLRVTSHVRVQLNGTLLTDSAAGIAIPVRRRRIGYVPQTLSLFPHLSVRQNLLFGSSAGDPHDRYSLEHMAEVLEISSLLERAPVHLSGGEAQRVALGRALLSRPQLLLLDEPLSSLGAPMKSRIVPLLLRIRDEFRVTTLYVSHDPAEIVTFCSEVLLLDNGASSSLRPTREVFEAQTETVYRVRPEG